MNAFRKHLAAFELRRGARRTEDAQAARLESIDDAAVERQLGADDREVDALAFGECDASACVSAGSTVDGAVAIARDAGVARVRRAASRTAELGTTASTPAHARVPPPPTTSTFTRIQ